MVCCAQKMKLYKRSMVGESNAILCQTDQRDTVLAFVPLDLSTSWIMYVLYADSTPREIIYVEKRMLCDTKVHLKEWMRLLNGRTKSVT